MLEKNRFCCSEFSCRRRLTSDSWRLKHPKLHHSKHLQVSFQKNLTICRAPHRIEHAQRREFNTNDDSVQVLDAIPNLDDGEHIADSESKLPPPLPRTRIYPCAGAPPTDFIAEPLECNIQWCLETNLQNNTYYLFVTREEYKYIQCGINKQGMKTYYDKVLKKENTVLRFPRFKNGHRVQKLVASIPNDQPLSEWELHTLKDMRWNDNHQCPVKHWSQAIIKTMRWLIRQPAYVEHLIFAPQLCVNCDRPLKHFCIEMHTADWW